jgi:penicillin-binding protein 2
MKTLRHLAVVFFSMAAAFALSITVPMYASSSEASTTTRSAKSSHTTTARRRTSSRVRESAAGTRHIRQTQHAMPTARASVRTAALTTRGRRRSRYVEHFTASSFTSDNTIGDVTAGEDPVVRAAAIAALGDMNGTAVAIDPANGRILAMVNQKLALSPGAEPCSTIKLMVGLAALKENIITRDTEVNLGGHYHLTLTQALAKSINPYFETLGRALGFERVKHYANMFGLGELSGYNIPGEQLGVYPDEPIAEKSGGVGRMCSFGEGISMTPLQLGALVSAMANGGTLYYLQHPTTPDAAASFTPMIKRQLDISKEVPQMFDGMEGAVDYGTARSLHSNFKEFPVLGKTGTCSNLGTRYGWFASIATTPHGKIVTVFFLEGGRPTFGPKAAELTGQFYRALYDSQYFGPNQQMPVQQTNVSRVNAPVMMNARYSPNDVPVQSGALVTTANNYSAPAAPQPVLPASYVPPEVAAQ